MSDHALLGPSKSKQWLTCTPSVRAETGYPNESNEAAEEGTLAHDICEVLIKERLGKITKQKAVFDFNALIKGKLSKYYNAEMLEYCKGFLAFVMEKWSYALSIDPRAVIIIEERFELARWIPESFGRTDVTIIAGHLMVVIDLKYGQGVRVEAKGNTQTRLYALGGLDKFKSVYPIQEVEMHIWQPRLQNFGTDRISAYELWEWAETFVKPRAQKAFVGLGDYEAGDHCKFCKAKPRCRTASEYARTPAGRVNFADPNTLTDEEIAEIALTLPLLMSYGKDVTAYMLTKALAQGKQWPGFKLVEGRSNRQIVDEQAAILKLYNKGYKEVYDTKIKPFGQLDAIVGATNLSEILGNLIVKPSGKPTLVPDGDTRTSYQTAASEFKPLV